MELHKMIISLVSLESKENEPKQTAALYHKSVQVFFSNQVLFTAHPPLPPYIQLFPSQAFIVVGVRLWYKYTGEMWEVATKHK